MTKQKVKDKITELTGIENFFHCSGRTTDVVNAKILYAKYMRDVLGKSYEEIKRDFGYAQHGSVMNLVRKFNTYSKYDYDLRDKFIRLSNDAKSPFQHKINEVVDKLTEIRNEADLDYIIEKMNINIKVRQK